jgi:predicted Zn-dependent protease
VAQSNKTTLLTLAGIATGVLLGVGGAAPAAASAVTVGSIAAGASASLAYSRENEMEADQIALKYLAKAGYSGEGLLKTLKKIRARNWYGSDQIPVYLTTHPATEDRIAYISSSMEGMPSSSSQPKTPEFQIIQTRLRAIYGEERIARNKFETAVKNQPDHYLSHYGYGLILTRTGDNIGAIEHFRKALENNPLDQTIIRELGRVYYLNGNYKEAYTMLTEAASPSYRDSEVRFYLGRTLKALGKPKDAVREFEMLLDDNPNYTPAYYHLGILYGEQEKMGEAHYCLGLYYRKKGQIRTSVFHLKRAIKYLDEMKKRKRAEDVLKSVGVDVEAEDG